MSKFTSSFMNGDDSDMRGLSEIVNLGVNDAAPGGVLLRFMCARMFGMFLASDAMSRMKSAMFSF